MLSQAHMGAPLYRYTSQVGPDLVIIGPFSTVKMMPFSETAYQPILAVTVPPASPRAAIFLTKVASDLEHSPLRQSIKGMIFCRPKSYSITLKRAHTLLGIPRDPAPLIHGREVTQCSGAPSRDQIVVGCIRDGVVRVVDEQGVLVGRNREVGYGYMDGHMCVHHDKDDDNVL